MKNNSPRVIGMLGGMSWASSAVYYRMINERIAKELGGLHSARILLNSVDFAEIVQWNADGDWDSVADRLGGIAQGLERVGAECMLIACVTQHVVAGTIAARINVPLISIVKVTGDAIAADGNQRIGLLGTHFTMTHGFFVDALANRGIDVLLPEGVERKYIHESILNEFNLGIFNDSTRQKYLGIIDGLVARGAQGIVLACTEIGMLVGQDQVPGVPLYDTTALHVGEAVRFSLDQA
ncbi:aspartate/glutamate racemase family protein [Actinomadura rubrisoli]|uniref:Amino acid racemase n=1 Tax=Actinomadura rubrisoli TaxID=2530368 RepID=A0A4R5AI77_9ACTN|nr:amino acid racemase [Actinomadura rubrisoli]TDD72211.1 amino acid racemase [Actinomadura rubrisoli]